MASKKKKQKLKQEANKAVQTEKKTGSLIWNTRFHMIGFLLLSFLLYGNTLNHEYTQDDAIVIYDNMFTEQGIEGIPGILKYDTFYGFFKEAGKAKLVSGGRYRPFTLIIPAHNEEAVIARCLSTATDEMASPEDIEIIVGCLWV